VITGTFFHLLAVEFYESLDPASVRGLMPIQVIIFVRMASDPADNFLLPLL